MSKKATKPVVSGKPTPLTLPQFPAKIAAMSLEGLAKQVVDIESAKNQLIAQLNQLIGAQALLRQLIAQKKAEEAAPKDVGK